MQNLLRDLTELLSKDDRLVSEGKLLKNKVIELALKIDCNLIKLLLRSKPIKNHFFADADGVLVFDKIKFQKFVSNKQFLPDSYTAFKNKIGLVNENGNYLSESKEVVLAWPYKDCVLEGGQTKEDQKRDEIFWNETLAPDEIDRLLAPKVFTNFKRYDQEGEHVLTGKGKIDFFKENLIIKGNNLLALHSLKHQFRGQVKLIYIDPPYNTGNDSFGYNNNFNHSSWLTFMKNRLHIARELLSDSGAIFIQCDDSEQAYLKVLCDEIYGSQNFINCIAVKMSEPTGVKMAHAQLRFPKIKEYILAYKKLTFEFTTIDKIRKTKWDDEYKHYLEGLSRESREKLRDIQSNEWNDADDVSVANSLLKKVRLVPVSEKLKGAGVSSKDEEAWKFENSWRIAQTVSSDSIRDIVKNMSKMPDQNVAAAISKDGVLFFYNTKANLGMGGRIRVTIADDFLFTNPCDFWQDIKTTGIAGEGDVSLKYGKKPEKLVARIIRMTSSRGDLVLDFHVGSGTTCAVAHKMGRQYIGIEQLDYGENDSVVRLKNVINGDRSGISKSVNWQGGGEFIYCELMKYNEAYVHRIHKAKTAAPPRDLEEHAGEGIYQLQGRT